MGVLWALCVLVTGRVNGQSVPQIINYQGRINSGGVLFTGTGQFAFALVSPGGATSYWSNDGSSVAGSQPKTAVSLNVSSGLYSVGLGDTTITNMTTAIPYSVFNNASVLLRVWFNDGTHGWQQLDPDQRINAVGYAMVAESVPNGAVGTAQLAPGVGVPPGTVLAYGGSVAPTGYLFCDGSAFQSTNPAYAALFAAIQTNWGNGSSTPNGAQFAAATSGTGQTDFNIPDLRGRFLRGVDNGAGNDPDVNSRSAMAPGGNQGDAVGSSQLDAFQGHTFTLNNSVWARNNGGGGGVLEQGSTNPTINDQIETVVISGPSTSGSYGPPRVTTETRPVNAYINYIIKY